MFASLNYFFVWDIWGGGLLVLSSTDTFFNFDVMAPKWSSVNPTEFGQVKQTMS